MPDTISIQRRLTEAFIRDDPTAITLIPTISVKTAGKGVTKSAGTPRAETDYKVIYTGQDGYNTSGDDGTYHKFDVVLVGTYDCECEIGDTWTVGQQKYIVHSEYPFNNYERKFGLITYGNTPQRQP